MYVYLTYTYTYTYVDLYMLTYCIDLDHARAQIHMQWINVGYSVHVSKKAGGHKHILKGVSGEVLPGELLAIMGTTVRASSRVLSTYLIYR